MPLTVICLATYLTRGDNWRDSDHVASKFVKALKGKPFNGYAMFPVNGRRVRLDSGDQARAAACFARVAARHLASEGFCEHDALRLVPIPSSDAVKGKRFTRFPARLMAKALAVALEENWGLEDVGVADILRWKTPKPASHTGGSRNALVLYENLDVIETPADNAAYVLVDDVCTGGGHLRACKRRIEEEGLDVAFGVCAGRTAQEPPDDPLAIFTEDLPDLIVPRRR